jgi:hypothetical protein
VHDFAIFEFHIQAFSQSIWQDHARITNKQRAFTVNVLSHGHQAVSRILVRIVLGRVITLFLIPLSKTTLISYDSSDTNPAGVS